MTPRKVFDVVREIKERSDIPIVLMGYYNPIFRMGDEKYIEGAAAASVDGMIVPDLPMEECGTLSRSCHASGIDLVQLVSPTTPFDRMVERIAKCSSGFLYVISALGTTGARKELSEWDRPAREIS